MSEQKPAPQWERYSEAEEKQQPPRQLAFPLSSELFRDFPERIASTYFQGMLRVYLSRSLPWYIEMKGRHGPGTELEERVERLEAQIESGVRPALARLTRHIEWHQERDSIPAAASGEYEWLSNVKEVVKTAEALLQDFDELTLRLSHHVKIIEQMRVLLNLSRSRSNRHLTSAVLCVYDALHSVYSEDMSLSQAETIKTALQLLEDLDWDREKVRSLDKMLRQQGFETVPSDKFVNSRHGTNTH